ncbi:MAG: HAAS signaling domain-containing protein [Candidatus Thorarchaeota archaeon]
MNEDPTMIIETYLSHVREHLPESMVNEVIAELRGYMIEMTEALSDGAMTNASAKRVVARFGAPSELAKEYILPDVDSTESVIRAHRLQQEPEGELSPASYARTFLVFITIAVLLLVICWSIITPFVPWWTFSVVLFAPAFQFGVVATVFAALLVRSMARGLQLRSLKFSNWSGLQKLVTFPENLALEIYSAKVLADICLTILTIVGFTSLMGQSLPFQAVIIGPPAVLFLIAHLVYAVRRLRNSDPVSFIRREFIVNIGLFLSLNQVVAWGSFPWMQYPVNSFLVWISLGYSTLILYQLVIRAQDLWWEASGSTDNYPEKSLGLSQDAKRKLLNRTKRTALRSIGGIGASFSAIIITGILILLLSNNRISASMWNMHGIVIVVVASFFAIASVGLASVYFGVRYYLVRSRGRTSVFGNRTRAEAAIDLLVTGTGFFIVLFSWPYWGGELVSIALVMSSGADPLFRFVLSIGFIMWGPLMVIAIVARMTADSRDLRDSDSSSALEAMVFSGYLFVIAAALLTGIYFMLVTYLDPFLTIVREMFFILMISYAVLVLSAFQKSTTGAMLRWRKENLQ